MSQVDPADIKAFLEFIGIANQDPKQFIREVLTNQQRITVSLENLAPPKPYADELVVAAGGPGTITLLFTFPDDGKLRIIRAPTIEIPGFTVATVDSVLVQGVDVGNNKAYTIISDGAPEVNVIGGVETYSPSRGGVVLPNLNTAVIVNQSFPRIFYPGDQLIVSIEVSAGTAGLRLVVNGEQFLPGCRPTFA